jgi:hypothetical protein
MNTQFIHNFLNELVIETFKELIRIYHNNPIRKTCLRIPLKRDETKRISEQEMRFVLTSMLERYHYPEIQYSVETPTEETYKFSGNKELSASSDMSLYYKDEKLLNIELKGNMPTQSAVDKDVEKLCREKHDGAWLHVFENEDRGTIKNLLEKFKIAFNKYSRSGNSISFHILVLKTKTLLSHVANDVQLDCLNDFFDIDYMSFYESNKKNQIKKKDYSILLKSWQVKSLNI